MGKKAKMIGTAAGVAAAATAAAVVVKKQGGAKKVAERVRRAAKKLPSLTVYHVKRSGEQWAVQAEGAARASSLHDTKREAVNEARALAAVRAPSQLVIHRVDGSVQDTRNYEKED